MTKLEIMQAISAAYDPHEPDFLLEFVDPETGNPIPWKDTQELGDTLAAFIVREVNDHWDPKLHEDLQRTQIREALRSAASQLEEIAEVL